MRTVIVSGRVASLGLLGAFVAGGQSLVPSTTLSTTLSTPLSHLAAAARDTTPAAFAIADTTSSSSPSQVADTTGLPAPSFTVMHWLNSTSTDSTVKFGDGHVYVLGFTGTWCEGCPATYPPLTDLAKKYAPKGVRVMLVSGLAEVTVDYIKQYYDREHITLPIAIAGLGSPAVFEDFGIMSVPTIVVIDQKGIVQYRWHGAEELTANSTTALNSLLGQSAAPAKSGKKS